jgi:hypothetical protein
MNFSSSPPPFLFLVDLYHGACKWEDMVCDAGFFFFFFFGPPLRLD